jgi:hypothetical protein
MEWPKLVSRVRTGPRAGRRSRCPGPTSCSTPRSLRAPRGRASGAGALGAAGRRRAPRRGAVERAPEPGRMLYRQAPVAVLLRRDTGEELEARGGEQHVVLTGPAPELVLHAFGRQAAARVVLEATRPQWRGSATPSWASEAALPVSNWSHQVTSTRQRSEPAVPARPARRTVAVDEHPRRRALGRPRRHVMVAAAVGHRPRERHRPSRRHRRDAERGVVAGAVAAARRAYAEPSAPSTGEQAVAANGGADPLYDPLTGAYDPVPTPLATTPTAGATGRRRAAPPCSTSVGPTNRCSRSPTPFPTTRGTARPTSSRCRWPPWVPMTWRPSTCRRPRRRKRRPSTSATTTR